MSKSTGCRNEPSTSENDTMTMRMRFLFAALTLALAAGSCSREPRTELFNGRDLAGWVCVTDPEGVGDARDAFSVQNGNIRIAGSPFGYMRTEETYDDYRLHVEWRWIGEATNSGIFQRVQAGDRLWPEAVECQLQAGRAGDLLGLGGAKIAGAESNGRVFIKPRSGGECERPAGEWNCAEIVCVGDHIAVCVNGVLQNECTGSVRSGYIALQSEGGPVEFRNIWLTRLRRGICIATGSFGPLSARFCARLRTGVSGCERGHFAPPPAAFRGERFRPDAGAVKRRPG